MHRLFGTSLLLAKSAENYLRGFIEEIGEGRRYPGKEQERWSEPARQSLGMVEGGGLGSELTEYDVKIGEDDQRYGCAESQSERQLDRERKIREPVGEDLANRCLGNPAESKAGKGDSKLARG